MSIKEKYTVCSIDAFQCMEWIKYKHYAKRIPCIEYSFGLFQSGILRGVCTFGTPSSAPIRGIFDDCFKVMELNRLCVDDELEKNVLSFFVASCLKALPSPLVVISYADTEQGHNGYIYQATNFIYTGLSAKRTDWKIKGMEHLHGATIADMSRGKENRAEFMREKFGDDFYLAERPRKHRYFYFLGSKSQVKQMRQLLPYQKEPYPKGENKRYDSDFKTTIQLNLFLE